MKKVILLIHFLPVMAFGSLMVSFDQDQDRMLSRADPGDIVISEIMADPIPAVELPPEEYIEIFNRSGNTINLGKWKLSSTDQNSFFPVVDIGPGEYLILTAVADTALFAPFGRTVGLKPFPALTDKGRIIVLSDDQGNFISQFGTTGMQPGEFNEPTSLAFAPDGTLYVADAWNQRIQSFTPVEDASYTPLKTWDIVGWYGQSLDNKPYLAVAPSGHVYASDPEGARILEFTADGEFIRYWGDFGSDSTGFNLPIGLSFDAQGDLWVADSGNNRLLGFLIPPLP